MPQQQGVIDYHDGMIIAHAVLVSVATLITAPSAILIGRYLRSRRWWFKAHLILQSTTAVFVIVGVALSLVAVASGGNGNQLTGPLKDPHHDLGFAILILFLVQFILGVVAHYTHSAGPGADGPFPTLTTPKSPLRHLHVVFGIVMTALMYAGVKTGMDEWNMVSDMGTLVPNGVVATYWVFFGIAVAAYLFGWILEPIRASRRQPSIASASDEKVPM
ncbi:hypothetical protein C8F04DRAFT_1068006 [Mycena alexandri]|uniref:Cytochrome b561 domain-containing protein n=1 Tax=Mycena alexandri TaxID=1745969 RepID=A0AAD6TH24_9AGAR|nr:hypothetical protein C8F04DRAFT_1068006 [Mycena alexandri]